MANLIFIGSIFLVFLTIYMLLFSKNAAKSYADYVLSFLLLEIISTVSQILILSSPISIIARFIHILPLIG